MLNGHSSVDQSINDSFQSFDSSAPLPEISKEFLKKLTESAQKIVERDGNLPLFTFINTAYKELTLNWLCNVAEFNNTLQRTIIVATSELFCRKLKSEWKEVICLSLRLGAEYEGSFEWGRQQYVNLLKIRAKIMLHLVQKKLPFVLFETDAIWLKDPTELFENRTFVDDADIIVPTKGYTHKGDTYSFDPMLVYPTKATLSLFLEMTRRLIKRKRTYDQDILEELCKNQFNGVICRQFEWNEIADGKWFKLSENERLQYKPYIVNNNYYVGVDNKIARQSINGLWFLSKMHRCVALKVRKALKKYNQTKN
ncbi:unnamed protein product, partial [Mesorhabditis belari]|uniref:Nucleotide-diphospho-sugar transferase domain-containing protein n=1 Tax=Mesorhabditis belari TaxID=2138241 RepID=A0AAF3J6Q8_9BILA